MLSLVFASFLMLASCGSDDVVPDFNDKVAADEQGGQNTEMTGMPVMGTYTRHSVNVEEISGICLNADKTALLAVGDQGVLKEIDPVRISGVVMPIWKE